MRINKAVLITILILGLQWLLTLLMNVVADTVIDLMQSGQLVTEFTFGEFIVWLQYLRLAVQAIGTYMIVRHFVVSTDDGEKRKRSVYRNDLTGENNLRSVDASETDAQPASKRKFQQQ